MNYVDRPSFSEGQLLSAAELQLTVDYPRGELETHASGAHTSGIVDGMTYDFVPPVAPGTAPSVYVTPGLAVDDLGRQMTIGSAMIVVADPLAGQPAKSFPAYVWYTEGPITSPAAVMNPCSTASSDVVRESANVGVFLSAAVALEQFPHAVCLGYVGWDGTSFQPYAGTDPDVRQGGGVRAYEIVAPENAVTAHSETKAPTTFSVKGTLQAIAADDLTAPVLAVAGGALILSPSPVTLTKAVPPSSSVSLSYFPNGTGNGLAINLGNNDSASEVTVNSAAGTVLASIGGSTPPAQPGIGTITAGSANVNTLSASNVVVATGMGAGKSTLTLGPTQPNGIAGITASDTLALAFGSAKNDEVTFVGGGKQVATIDADTITSNGVQIGTLDASGNTCGLGITTSGDLEIRTQSGDLLFNPGSKPSPAFRLTAQSRLMNQTVSPPADVTPLTSTGPPGSVLRLGSLAVAFGTTSIAGLHPLTASPDPIIVFPVTFAAVPAFFVTVLGQGLQTIFAVPTLVTPGSANYRISRFKPDAPTDLAAAKWSNTSIDVTISWVALGMAV